MFNKSKQRITCFLLMMALLLVPLGATVAEAKTTDSPFYSSTFTHNSVYDDCILVHGIDVSKYQGNIDWQRAKAAGVEFAFIRVGFRGYGAGGNFGADTYYDQNMQGAIAAGISVGVYFFSQATTPAEAVEEANYILERIGSYKISMPLVMDFEYASENGKTSGRLYDANLSSQDATNVCLAFCDTIKASGYSPMVYANLNMLEKHLYADQIQSKYDIWLANYTNQTSYSGLYSFWQYGSSGKVDGITGNVDCNFWYKKVPDKAGALTTATPFSSGVTLSWNAVNGAQGYQIYRSDTLTGNYQRIATVSDAAITVYTDISTSPAHSYYYKVRGYLKFSGSNYFGGFSPVLGTFTTPNEVQSLTAKPESTSSINLTWDAVENSDGYRVYRYDEAAQKFVSLKTLTKGDQTSYTDSGLLAGSSHQYTVAAFTRIDGTARFGSTSEAVTCLTIPAKVSELKVSENTADHIRLDWQPVTGADGYQIYSYDAAAKKYVRLTTVSADALTFDYTELTPSTEYKFKVRAYQKIEKTNYFGAFSSVITAITTPDSVQNLTAKPSGTSSIRLTWDAVKNSDGYRVYRYDEAAEKFVKLVTISKGNQTSYTDTGLLSGSSYQYQVAAFTRINGVARFGSTGEAVTCPTLSAKVDELKVGGKTASRIRLNWQPVTGADGYQIYSYDAAAKKYVKLVTIPADEPTYVCADLTPSSEYKFKIRAYQKIEKTNYFGAFSNVLTAKTGA